MNNKYLGKVVFETAWGHKFYVVQTRDVARKRVSVDFYMVTPEGEMSEIISVERSDIFKKKGWNSFLYGYEAKLGRDEVMEISDKVIKMVRQADTDFVDIETKATPQEVYENCIDFIYANKESLEDNADAKVFIHNGYGCIETKEIERFIKEYREELRGYKRVDILKCLKFMGKLIPGNGRPYDAQMRVKGNLRKCYRILLPERAEMAEVVSMENVADIMEDGVEERRDAA